jgi:hypothetical protein
MAADTTCFLAVALNSGCLLGGRELHSGCGPRLGGCGLAGGGRLSRRLLEAVTVVAGGALAGLADHGGGGRLGLGGELVSSA